MTAQSLVAPGFAQPVADAQRTFRAALEALARPTLAQRVDVDLQPPAPLGPVAGALVLTLCDAQTPVWLDPALARTSDVAEWIRFHTGAPIADEAADAEFCVASCPSASPALADLRQGTDEEPHRSATVIIDAGAAKPTGAFTATGPGVNGSVRWDGAGLPGGFLPQWHANTARFPRGVDLLIAGENEVRGLPRTTILTEVS